MLYNVRPEDSSGPSAQLGISNPETKNLLVQWQTRSWLLSAESAAGGGAGPAASLRQRHRLHRAACGQFGKVELLFRLAAHRSLPAVPSPCVPLNAAPPSPPPGISCCVVTLPTLSTGTGRTTVALRCPLLYHSQE